MKWSMKDLKNKGIFVNQDGVGKVLVLKEKKVVTEDQIKKVLEKLRKNDKNRGKTT